MTHPIRQIDKLTIWLLAGGAMAYFFMPVFHTEASQGLFLLMFFMIMLGASDLWRMAVSGIVLSCRRTFREGDYLRIGQYEGTVTKLGMFFTRLTSDLGEELTLSNIAVLKSAITNYSRASDGGGFGLETTIIVSYDTPEKKVQEILQLAAHQTIGVSKASSPIVVQVAQSKRYRKFRLTCQATPTKLRTRTILLSDLHANIQDALKEYGVQLQSNYSGSPQSSFSVTDVVRY